MMAAFNIPKRHLLRPRRLGTRDILNKSRFEAVVNTSGFQRLCHTRWRGLRGDKESLNTSRAAASQFLKTGV